LGGEFVEIPDDRGVIHELGERAKLLSLIFCQGDASHLN
jgi:hypothetical protein